MDHVAKLAKLNLTKEENEKFTPQIEAIIDFIGQLKEVDTTGIEPTSQTTGLTNVFRVDEAKASELPITNYYKVGQILKNRTNE